MKRAYWSVLGKVLLVAGMALSLPALADFEVTGPDGRRIVLKDDGTWQYVDARGKAQAGDKVQATGEAVLLLESKVEGDRSCRFFVVLVNDLPYEIRSFVPHYSAYRANGVLHETVFAKTGFSVLRPSDKQRREIQFTGIACRDIARVQVGGGDRCNMGELHKFSEGTGQCLARVRVAESDLVRFDK